MLSLMNSAIELGYEKYEIAGVERTFSPHSGIFRIFSLPLDCLLRGNCDINQRRRAFFEAGMVTGTTIASLARAVLIRMKSLAKQMAP
jgi:hypothetical protein